MEVALMSAATGALKPVIQKLAKLLGDEYTRFKGVRDEINFLTRELAAMDAFLLKMLGEEDPDVQDKAWMAEVRELSYDMEDSIDDFMRNIDDQDAKTDGLFEKIKHSLKNLGKVNTRNRIGNEVKDLKKQIIEVGDRNARYKTREAFSRANNTTVDPRALAIFKHSSKLIGIDEPKAEIIQLLTKEGECSSTQQQVKLVSIVGHGGMGKTTLANQVYQELKGEFKCRAFLSVSRNPDMMNILRTILSEISGQCYATTEAGSIQQLLNKITNFLAGKRYFIVVDDIWDAQTWDVIHCAFPMISCGSIIITTTRIKDIAESCRSTLGGHIYNIRPLLMVHLRQLFHERLFNSLENCPSYLEEVSEQILKKCAGLPLAIIAISGVLANTERTRHNWNQMKDSIGRTLERNPSIEGMMKILSLSYFDLPPHLKTCLLYLSIFPEDSIIEKKDLIRRWIAEGFIHIEGKHTMHELGERCFSELLNRNLIEPVKMNDYGMVKSCRVHDTIMDFLISESIKENFITFVGVPNLTVETQCKVRRLSLQVHKQGSHAIPTSMVLSHVRSLNVFGWAMEIPSLDEFRHLRVLDFTGCFRLRNHHFAVIGRLFQLRHLNLRRTGVSELPKQIGHLRCLEMLDLRDTQVLQLPSAIINLGRLVHLLADKGVKFPDGIEKMQALGTLKRVSVFNQPFNLSQKLGQLKNLKKLVLDFTYYSCVNEDERAARMDCSKAIVSSLHNLGSQNLRSLTIYFGRDFLGVGPMCPIPLSLQKLMTYQSNISQVPKWVERLVNLQQLRLEVHEIEQNDLHLLGALPTLLILDLKQTGRSKHFLFVYGAVGFPCLRKFGYYLPLEGRMDLIFAAGSMPKLEKLEIGFDMGEIQTWNVGIENLPCLVTVKCIIYGNRDFVQLTKASLERAAIAHPNRPTVNVEEGENWIPKF